MNDWEQLPDEENSAYSWFLCYRNLGPCRTLIGAYHVYVNSFPNASGGKKTQSVPGSWGEASSRHRWVERATAWDVHNFARYGDRLANLWIGILTKAAEKCAAKLADEKCQPKDFMQAIAVIDKLAPYLTTHVVPKQIEPVAGPAQPGQPTLESVR